MTKLFIFLTIIFMNTNVFACMSEPAYIDFNEIKQSATVNTSRLIILRHTREVKFNESPNLQVTRLKTNTIGGLHSYKLTPVFTQKSQILKTTINAFDISKKIKIHLEVNKAEIVTNRSVKSKGCGGTVKIKYN